MLWIFCQYFLSFLGLAYGQSGSCLCVDDTGNNVTVRARVCSDVIKQHTVGACFTSLGNTDTCDGETVVEIQYGPNTAWATATHLVDLGTERCAGIGGDCSRLDLVTRSEWNATDPVAVTPIQAPLSGVFVHHSAMSRCFTQEECKAEVYEIQRLHVDTNGWDDIGYHWLVGEDGRVYEGRGWDTRGAHARQHNAWTYGICVMGDFRNVTPNDAALNALRDIIDCGVQQGKITQGFELFGHRDGVCTECPGQALYDVIQTWPYYSHREITVDC